jgi:hypothetical protein
MRFLVDEMALKQDLSDFLRFFLLINIPPLPYNHLPPTTEVFDTSDQAAHYHILAL